MKYLDEYRDPAAARKMTAAIRGAVTRPWTIMEVCGGQTHSIVKYGVDRVLPPEIELVHGPGCPVWVTALEMIDRAHAIAARPEVTFCSFGDMLRVPGSHGDLLQLKKKPHECPAFGGACTPHTPLGATMVSSEGACAAYYAYGRRREADVAAQTPELSSLVQIGGGG